MGGERRMTTVAAPQRSDIRRALALAGQGERLDTASTTALLAATGPEFDELVALAGAARDEGLSTVGRSGVITYSRRCSSP